MQTRLLQLSCCEVSGSGKKGSGQLGAGAQKQKLLEGPAAALHALVLCWSLNHGSVLWALCF